jgi:hypothetical protein
MAGRDHRRVLEVRHLVRQQPARVAVEDSAARGQNASEVGQVHIDEQECECSSTESGAGVTDAELPRSGTALAESRLTLHDPFARSTRPDCRNGLERRC